MERLLQAADVISLSELTPHQLREWCGRRGIVQPDVPPNGPGRHALYSWRTILVLRILRELHCEFGIEVSALKGVAAILRVEFESKSFVWLSRAMAVLRGREDVTLSLGSAATTSGAAIYVPLAGHLRVIATELGVALPDQLPLFPPLVVSR